MQRKMTFGLCVFCMLELYDGMRGWFVKDRLKVWEMGFGERNGKNRKLKEIGYKTNIYNKSIDKNRRKRDSFAFSGVKKLGSEYTKWK